jgi:hypothetical protein
MKGSLPFSRGEVSEGESGILLSESSREHGEVFRPPAPAFEIGELRPKLAIGIRSLQTRLRSGDVHGAMQFRERRTDADEKTYAA